MLPPRWLASALGCVALLFGGVAQATIILQAQPGPAAGTIRLDLVSDHPIANVAGLTVSQLISGPSALQVVGVEYPASFLPSDTVGHHYPSSVLSLDDLRTPGYVFTGPVDVDAGPLFRWLLEVPAGTQGPFRFAADLSVGLFDESMLEFSTQTTLAAIPEPEPWSLLAAAGLAGLRFGWRRSHPGRAAVGGA